MGLTNQLRVATYRKKGVSMKVCCVICYRGYEIQRFHGNDVNGLEQKAKKFIANEIKKSELIHPEKFYYYKIIL